MHRLLSAILLCLAVTLAWPPLGAQAPTGTQIAASWHILVLLSDGTVSAPGQNRSGQLGRPKSTRAFLPAARVDLPARAVQVAAGDEEASFALLEDGTVWAWGKGRSNNGGCEARPLTAIVAAAIGSTAPLAARAVPECTAYGPGRPVPCKGQSLMQNELLVMLLVGGALFASARMVRALPGCGVALAQTRRLGRRLLRSATRAQ